MTATITESPLSPLRAVSYVRVCTLDQARRDSESEGLSIPAQREANRRRASEMGALVVAEFVERGRSGRSIERHELRRMLEYIQGERIEQTALAKLHRRQAVSDERFKAITVEAQTIDANQARLLEAYYAHAIPREVLPHPSARSQGRTGEPHPRESDAGVREHRIQQRGRGALDPLQDAHARYTDAPATVRKQLSRAIFAGIVLGPEPGQIRADLNEPFASITQPG